MESAVNNTLLSVVPSGHNLYGGFGKLFLARRCWGFAKAVFQHWLYDSRVHNLMGDPWHKLQRPLSIGCRMRHQDHLQSLLDPAQPLPFPNSKVSWVLSPPLCIQAQPWPRCSEPDEACNSPTCPGSASNHCWPQRSALFSSCSLNAYLHFLILYDSAQAWKPSFLHHPVEVKYPLLSFIIIPGPTPATVQDTPNCLWLFVYIPHYNMNYLTIRSNLLNIRSKTVPDTQ